MTRRLYTRISPSYFSLKRFFLRVMFLSHSANKPRDKSGTSAPSSPSASSQSNAKQLKSVPDSKVHRLATKIQESLVHVPIAPSLSPSTNSSSEISQDAVPVVTDTVYLGVSQSPGSLFFDLTTYKESERTLYKLTFLSILKFCESIDPQIWC